MTGLLVLLVVPMYKAFESFYEAIVTILGIIFALCQVMLRGTMFADDIGL